MKDSHSQTQPGASDAPPAGEWGWYLYGITQRNPQLENVVALIQGMGGQPVQVLYCRDLAAVTSPVPLTEFKTTAIQARLQDPSHLEAMVGSHEGVVRAVQLERTILPARLGLVHATKEDLVASLERLHDELVAQLERLEGCDEWGVKLYADRLVVRERAAVDNPAVRELKQRRASATLGRAYFLDRKLADVLETATEQALVDLAQAAYDHLAPYAIAGQLDHRPRASLALASEDEILRAAFIVARNQLVAFVGEIHRLAKAEEGLRCEYSGPWAPYSFALLKEAVSP